MTPITDDSYIDKMRLQLRYAYAWMALAGLSLGVLPSCAAWFIYSSDKMTFYAGASAVFALWVIFVSMGRAETCYMRIATEMSSLHTLAIIQLSAAGKTSQRNPQRPWLVEIENEIEKRKSK